MSSPSLQGPEHSADAPAHRELVDVFGRSNSKAIRRSLRREEAYVRSVAVVNYFYAVWFGFQVIGFVVLAFQQLSGKISAPWLDRPGWVAIRLVTSVLAVLALIAGYGFWGLERWAFRVEVYVVLGVVALFPLGIVASSARIGPWEFVAQMAVTIAFITPLIDLPDLRGSKIFLPEYQKVIAESPGVRVKPKAPKRLKFAMLVLLAAAIAAQVLAAR